MIYYSNPDIHFNDKVKVVLDSVLDYVTKKELEHATGVYIYNLAAQSDFIILKAEVDKLRINELFKVPTGLNDLKAKIDNNLNVIMLKTFPADF